LLFQGNCTETMHNLLKRAIPLTPDLTRTRVVIRQLRMHF
jgi:hypothetical protein